MRPKTQRLSAAGFGAWIPLDWRAYNIQVGLAVKLSSGASLTYTVDHTFDDLQTPTNQFSLSRTTTTATMTKTNHGLSVDDYLGLSGCGAPFDGTYAVASVADANTLTFTVANSGLTALANGVGSLITARIFPHETLAAQTASADGNYAFPPRACRLRVTTYASGFADLAVITGGR
jgi:hypothetical protein